MADERNLREEDVEVEIEDGDEEELLLDDDAVPLASDIPDVEVESLDEALAKKEPVEDEPEEESVLTLSREERLEPLATKVLPPQPTEFVCKKCFLVKHRSQLKNASKMICRDCA